LDNYYDSVNPASIPTTPTLDAEGFFKSIKLTWNVQSDLQWLKHFELQVSDDEVDWYSLQLDGSDWKDTLDAHTIVLEHHFKHDDIPLEAGAIGTTLFYRVRRRAQNDNISSYSTTASSATTGMGTADIVADAITNAKVAINAIDTLEIADNAITADKIISNAVLTQKLSVVARDYVNNITTSGVLDSWGNIDEEGAGTPVNLSLYADGTQGDVLRLTNNGNAGLRSQSFKINHNKIYKTTIMVKKSSTDGLIYFGLSSFTTETGGLDSTGDAQGTETIKRYDATTRAFITSSVNGYFTSGFDSTTWIEVTS